MYTYSTLCVVQSHKVSIFQTSVSQVYHTLLLIQTSVLGFLLLWKGTITMAVLKKKTIFIESLFIVQRLSPLSSWWEAWQHAGRHSAGEVAQSSPSGLSGSRQWEWHLAWLKILKPQNTLQWYIFFNKVTHTSCERHSLCAYNGCFHASHQGTGYNKAECIFKKEKLILPNCRFQYFDYSKYRVYGFRL